MNTQTEKPAQKTDRKQFSIIVGIPLITALLLPGTLMNVALFLILFPLVAVTRKRLRDLDMADIFLLIFPVMPLARLIFDPAIPVGPIGPDGTFMEPLFLSPEIFIGFAFGLFLALTPGTAARGVSETIGRGAPDIAETGGSVLTRFRDHSALGRPIDQMTFLRWMLGCLGVIFLINAAAAGVSEFLIGGKAAAVAALDAQLNAFFHYDVRFSQVRAGLRDTLQDIVLVVALGPVVRRLKMLGKSFRWALLFPLSSGYAASLMRHMLFELPPHSLAEGLGIFPALACFLTLCFLLAARSEQEKNPSAAPPWL